MGADMLLLAGFLLALQPPMGDAKPVANELLGVWQWRADVSQVWEITEDMIVVKHYGGRKGDGIMKYRIAADKSPKQIDVTHTTVPAVGKTTKGIYKVDKDTLTISIVQALVEDAEKRPRPAQFDFKKTGIANLTFDRSVKRVKRWAHRDVVQTGAAS